MNRTALALIIAIFPVVIAQAQIKVACIGNSITSGTGTSTPSYVPRLQTLLGSGYTVQNEGVSGTTLLKNGDNSYWKNGLFSQLWTFQPNIVTIKLGTNDTKPQNWDSYNSQFRRDYEAMIDTLNTLPTKPKIFLVLPVPIWTNTYGIRDSALQKMIPILKSIGANRGLWIIDANTPLQNFSNYFADGVHPNAAGADTIANVIYHTLIGAPASFRFVGRSHTTTQGTLPYRLYYPYKFNPSIKYPLILTLHGVGESGTDNLIHIQKNRVAEIWAEDTAQAKQNCFVVSPQCPTNRKWVEVAAWTDCFYSAQTIAESVPLTIVRSLLDSLIREFPIDTNRQYVTGLSMGGYGTWDLIVRYPGKFAAAVPLCGGCDTSKAPAIRNVPIWTFHGAVDPTVPVNATRSMMNTHLPGLGVSVTSYTCQYASYFTGSTITRTSLSSIINGGAKTLYCEYTDGVHDIWAKTFNEPLLAQWLFLQHKTSPVGTAGIPPAYRNVAVSATNVFPVLDGACPPSLFAGLKAGSKYKLRLFDAKGVITGRVFADGSSVSPLTMRKAIAAFSSMKWVEVEKF